MITETSNSGQELIDATQNVLMQAADKVSEIIEPAAAPSHGHGVFYENPEFWVGMAFIFVVAALFLPISKALGGMIKKRISGISSQINEAAALKDDAQKLLAAYEAKFQNVRQEAAALAEKSQKQVDLIKAESLKKLEDDMDIRKKETENRIASAQDEAVKEIAGLAAGLTVRAVKEVVAANLDENTRKRLIDDAIDKIA